VLLKESGQLTEAIESYEKAIQCFHQQFGAADTAPVPRGYVVEGAVDGAGAAIMAGDGVMRCVTKDSMAVVLTDLGTRLKLAGNVEEGIARYREALRFNANYAPAYFNLGVAYSESGHFAEALRFYNMALDRNPQYVEVLCNIGVIRKNTGHLESAISYYERAVRVNPNFMIANNNLAIAYTDMGTKVKNEGRIEEGIMYYKRSLQHNPKYPDAWYNLGVAHAEQGRFDDALVCYELAVSFNSNCAQAYNNLGVIYKDRGNLERAIACYQNALKANPSFAQTLNNLGVIYTMLGQLDQAYLYCQRAIQTNPDYAEAFNNLGVLFRDEGRILEALDSYASCLRLDPDSRSAGQNRLLALNSLTEDVLDRLADPTRQSLVMHASAHAAFIAGVRPPSSFADVVRLVFEEHRSWGRRFSALFPAARHWDNEPRRDRVLRIGYLSADFFTHSVSYFIEAPLRFADRRRFFVVCYSNVGREDAKTERLRKLAHAWRSVVGLNTQQVCQMVRDDRIDILVELTGHTAGNRLDVMAAKPAPVQVSWIGYPNTTGLETVDYRLSDAVADPPASEQQYVEELVRFDGPFLCYTPLHDAPEPSPSPALRQGFVTFGSFNNLAKVNDR
jgi:predicted O-linked N-acetylglucosamine transferase (SPINDLY family)